MAEGNQITPHALPPPGDQDGGKQGDVVVRRVTAGEGLDLFEEEVDGILRIGRCLGEGVRETFLTEEVTVGDWASTTPSE